MVASRNVGCFLRLVTFWNQPFQLKPVLADLVEVLIKDHFLVETRL